MIAQQALPAHSPLPTAGGPPATGAAAHGQAPEVFYQDPTTDSDLDAAIDAALATLEPDHYYGHTLAPVFRPTPLQFRDFSRFIAAAEPYARRAGLCKIIPPPEWLQELHHHQVQERGLKAEPTVSSAPTQRIFLASDDFPPMRPLVQHFEGSKGIYKQYNVENHRKVSLSRFYDLCVEARHTPPKSPPLAQPTSVTDSPASAPPAGVFIDFDRQLAYTTARQLSIPSLPLQGSDDADSMDHMSPAQQPKLVDYFNDLDRNYWRNLSFGPPLYGADIPGTLFPPPPVFPTWNPQDLGTVLNRINIPMPGVNQPYLYLGMWKSTFAWHVEDMDLYSINFLHFGQPKSWYCIPPAHRARFERAMQSIFPEDARTCSEFLRHKAFLVSPSILKSQYDIPVHRLVQTQGEFIITFPNGYHAGFNQGFNCAESVNFALPSWVPLGKKAAPCKCIGDSVRIAVEEFYPDNLGDTDYWREQRRGDYNGLTERWALENSSPQLTPTKAKKRPLSQAHQDLTQALAPQPVKSRTTSVPADGLPLTCQALTKYYALPSSPACVATFVNQSDRCGICWATLATQDSVVECSGENCRLRIHPTCEPSAVTGTADPWRCLRCHVGAQELRCALCPVSNGALCLISPLETLRKLRRMRRSHYTLDLLRLLRQAPPNERATYLRFAHPMCVRWIPETEQLTDQFPFPLNAENAEVVDGESTISRSDIYAAAFGLPVPSGPVQSPHSFERPYALTAGYELIPKARWGLKCFICKSKDGACVQCAEKRCCVPFHVSCLLLVASLTTACPSSDVGDPAKRITPQLDLENQLVYCAKHNPPPPHSQ